MKYLDKTKITKYVALEPNTNMHDRIRLAGAKEGYSEADGTLIILPYGIENPSSILSALHNHKVDTIIAINVLCSIPNPQRSITNLILETLKPGGAFLYYEHVLSSKKDVAWWQRFWAPIWSFIFDGCRLDRPSHLYVDQARGQNGESVWRERDLRGIEGETEVALHLFEHRIGRYIKA
jgi:SAM-dependent methyltransferase